MPIDYRQTLVWAITILIALLPPASAAARQDGGATPTAVSQAGLVVQHGDGSLTYAVVAFPEESISGIELLRRSGIAYLSIPFGGLGEGVCQIETEGCEVSECRRVVCQSTRSSPYWQYLDQTEAAVWRAAPLGASGSRVTDGDVLAWAWAAGTPVLPAVDLVEVAAAAGLDQAALETFGQAQTRDAVVRSGYSGERDVVSMAPVVGGVAALLIVAGAGVGLLFLRRRRVSGT